MELWPHVGTRRNTRLKLQERAQNRIIYLSKVQKMQSRIPGELEVLLSTQCSECREDNTQEFVLVGTKCGPFISF
jgi:hypothetical protein